MFTLTLAKPGHISHNLSTKEIEQWRDNNGAVCAIGYQHEGDYWIQMPSLASYRFNLAATEVVAVPDPSAEFEIIEDTFYRSVLPLILQVSGQEVLHASGVVMRAGVTAFCAISETGKSTIAYALSRRGYTLWADDSILFDEQNGHMQTTQLPFTIRLREASVAHFGDEALDFPALVTAPETQPQKQLPLAAICILSRTDGDSVVDIREIAPADALAAVLPHAYCFSMRDMDRKRCMMQNYFKLAMNVPMYSVQFRPGLAHLDTVLDAIIQTLK